MPALRLASLVLESEGENTVSLLNGVLALGVGAGEHAVDDVEGRGGRELGYGSLVFATRCWNAVYVPFAKPILMCCRRRGILVFESVRVGTGKGWGVGKRMLE